MQQGFLSRMSDNGLNPDNPEDVAKQRQLDKEHPIRDVLDSVWKEAEGIDKQAQEELRSKPHQVSVFLHLQKPQTLQEHHLQGMIGISTTSYLIKKSVTRHLTLIRWLIQYTTDCQRTIVTID